MLGVSPATLRRWSAAGEVEAFTTPGGHRRYAKSTIQHLLPQPVGRDATVADLGESPERLARIVERHVRAVRRDIGWLEGSDEETRRALTLGGWAMVEGLLGYVDGRGREREAALRPAIAAAALHGRLAAEHHGDLGEVVEAFHGFRGLLVDELAELACRRGLATPDAMRLLGRANDGVDRLIIAIVEAHAAAEVGDCSA